MVALDGWKEAMPLARSATAELMDEAADCDMRRGAVALVDAGGAAAEGLAH